MSRGPRDGGRDPERPSSSNSRAQTAYRNTDSSAAHRRKLESMFSSGGGGAGRDRGRGEGDKVFSSPRKSLGRGPSEYRMRLERLRAARGEEEIEKAADGFLAHHQLPDDIDILYKLLHHPAEKVLREVMGQISSLLMQRRLGSTVLLEDRLRTLDGQVQEKATQSYIDGLKSQLLQHKGAS